MLNFTPTRILSLVVHYPSHICNTTHYEKSTVAHRSQQQNMTQDLWGSDP